MSRAAWVSLKLCLFWGAQALGAMIAHAQAAAPAQSFHGYLVPSDIGGPFSLRDQHNRAFSLDRLKGRYALLFFGYTACPDACPTTLAEAVHLRALMGRGQRPEVVFITLDPERDTARLLKDYLGAFEPAFVGLRGTRAEIKRVADAYRVSYAVYRSTKGTGGYTVDHSAHTYLLDPHGKVILTYPLGTSYRDIARDLAKLSDVRLRGAKALPPPPPRSDRPSLAAAGGDPSWAWAP